MSIKKIEKEIKRIKKEIIELENDYKNGYEVDGEKMLHSEYLDYKAELEDQLKELEEKLQDK